jgi:hypothetical protein
MIGEMLLMGAALVVLILYIAYVIHPIESCPATIKIANLRMAGCPER